ncbi:MAG: type II toxin-antitoxin system PemK/MazF family toxin [Clostridiaceae bacterium]
MVEKWSLYWVSLDPVVGSEQAGTRPVLVISNNAVNEILPVITVLPVSSVKGQGRVYPTEIYLPMSKTSLPKDSIAMVHQIRTVSKERLGKNCGVINDNIIRNSINNVIKEYFELDL